LSKSRLKILLSFYEVKVFWKKELCEKNSWGESSRISIRDFHENFHEMSGLELSSVSWFWVKSERVKRKLNRERWEYYDQVLSLVQTYRGQCLCKNKVCSVLEERDYEYVWIAWTMKQARCMESLLIENSVHPFFWGSVLVCEIEDTCKARMKCQDERGHMIGCHFTNISNIKYILALY
jgi:hypothetical protein